MARTNIAVVTALALLGPITIAATPDICARKIEGVSITMSYAEAKAEWSARGYRDTTPALLPGKGRQRPNNQELVTFEKSGGANLLNPGGMTLTWQKNSSGHTTVSLSEAEATPGAPNQRLRERWAEFCQPPARSTNIECSSSPPYIAVLSPAPDRNLQCRYSAAGNRQGGASMVSEAVQIKPVIDERTENRLKAIMDGKRRGNTP